jgi:hypothetical protein
MQQEIRERIIKAMKSLGVRRLDEAVSCIEDKMECRQLIWMWWSN